MMAKLNGVEIPDRIWNSLSASQKQYYIGNPEYVKGFYNAEGEIYGIGSERGPHWGWQTEGELKRLQAQAAAERASRNSTTANPTGTRQNSNPLDFINRSTPPTPVSAPIPRPTTTPLAAPVSAPSTTPSTPSTVSATPSTISPATQSSPPPPVKTAPIDTILFNDDVVPIEIMADLIFENIGGQELINVARNDTVNGQTIIYQPIKNLTSIQQEYNPNNIVALQATSDKYFENFAIKFDTKVPEAGTGENGAHVYIDPETGSLVVEAINLDPDEQIELEITTSGTIYEADI